MPEDVFTRIRLLDERLARLRQERGRLAARASQADRRRDTRRKIVVGATVLSAVEHGGVPAFASLAELERWLDSRLTRPYARGGLWISAKGRDEVARAAGPLPIRSRRAFGPGDGESRPSGALWRFCETAPCARWPAGDDDERPI